MTRLKESVEDIKLWSHILSIMKKKNNWSSSWSSSHFFISDMEIITQCMSEEKTTIYHSIRYHSEMALDKIYDLMNDRTKKYNFEEAMFTAKHEFNLPLLNKIRDSPSRGIIGGWKQPSLETLDLDQRNRLFHHEVSLVTSQNRSTKIEEMREKEIVMKVKQ